MLKKIWHEHHKYFPYKSSHYEKNCDIFFSSFEHLAVYLRWRWNQQADHNSLSPDTTNIVPPVLAGHLIWPRVSIQQWQQPTVPASWAIVSHVAAAACLSGTSFPANWLHVCKKDRSRYITCSFWGPHITGIKCMLCHTPQTDTCAHAHTH